jgi:hypothetical protein
MRAGLVNEVAGSRIESPREGGGAAIGSGRASGGDGFLPPDTDAAFVQLRESILRRTGGHQPALLAAIDVVEQTLRLPGRGVGVESRIFGEVTAGVVCKISCAFSFSAKRLRKRTLEGWFEDRAGSEARRGRRIPGEKFELAPVQRVGVVGAGVMGSGIAQWLAAHGFKVVLREWRRRFLDRGSRGRPAAVRRSGAAGKLSAGEANSGMHRIAATTRWEGFETCDLVVEAIVENVAAKQALFRELASVVAPTAVWRRTPRRFRSRKSRTRFLTRSAPWEFISSIPSAGCPRRTCPRTTHLGETAGRALALRKSLGKTPVICRSSPDFWSRGCCSSTSTRRCDSGNTECPRTQSTKRCATLGGDGPLRLIDEVGVDVTDFILGEMEHYFRRALFADGHVRLDGDGRIARPEKWHEPRDSTGTTVRRRPPTRRNSFHGHAQRLDRDDSRNAGDEHGTSLTRSCA